MQAWKIDENNDYNDHNVRVPKAHQIGVGQFQGKSHMEHIFWVLFTVLSSKLDIYGSQICHNFFFQKVSGFYFAEYIFNLIFQVIRVTWTH